MKVFRDIVAAIMVGIMGGLLVSTISYYNDHKEGGIMQTLFAVTNSFGRISEAYSGEPQNSFFADEDYQVSQAFKHMESEEEIFAQENGDKLYSDIIRFHVRANSDSEEDQELKMAVKEDVVAFLNPLLSECKNVGESRNVIIENLQNIYTTAIHTITEQGYDYTVRVYLTEETFPEKTYGDVTFPQGDYQALRIDIGEAKGQNWWCVMYPPLCFIDESTAVVDAKGKEILKENLTPEEYANLFIEGKDREGEEVEFKMESWIYNLFK